MHYYSIVLYLISLIITQAISTNNLNGITLDLTHVDHGHRLTKFNRLENRALRSQVRAAALSVQLMPRNSDPHSRTYIPFEPSGGLEYVLELSIGTPPRPYTFILDTGSDLVWTQCKPYKTCIKQPAPLFESSKSSTFSPLPCSNKLCQDLPSKNCTKNDQCNYYYSYADKTFSYGQFARETFTLGTANKVKVPIDFGCGNKNGGSLNNASGIAGFGRASFSLVSQLGVPGFSYCMTDDIDKMKKSPLKFGTQEEIYRNIAVPPQTTPFVINPPSSSIYYVVMTGITVGKKWLDIPKSAFSSGTVFDSGTAFTQLPEIAYNELKKAFVAVVKLPLSNKSPAGLECFSSRSILPSRVKVPKVIFHFPGIDMVLPRNNYVRDIDDEGLLCLTVMKSSDLGIIGNTQQQNMQVMYDLANSRLAIAPTQCDKQ